MFQEKLFNKLPKYFLIIIEENQKKADLTERVIFKAKSKVTENSDKPEKSSSKKDKKASKALKSKLSFVDDEDEEEGRRNFYILKIFGLENIFKKL